MQGEGYSRVEEVSIERVQSRIEGAFIHMVRVLIRGGAFSEIFIENLSQNLSQNVFSHKYIFSVLHT